MDGHRSDPLTDSTLERDIEVALHVDPSPEFLARVRARIATEAATSRWSVAGRRAAGWQLLAAGVAVAVIAIVVAARVQPRGEVPASREATAPPVARGGAAEEPSPGAEPLRGRSTGLVVSSPPVDAPDAAPRIASRSVDPAPRAERRARRLPEVLISTDEQRAIDFLLTAASEEVLERLPVDANAHAELLASSEVEIAPIPAIAPLRIEPLPPIARLEIGGTQ